MGKGGSGRSVASSKAIPVTQAETDSIFDYTTSRYVQINSALRQGDALAAKDRPVAANLDSAIEKSTLPAGTTLYRGSSLEALGLEGSIKNMSASDVSALVGKKITDKAYVSTSKDSAVASRFSGQSMATKGNVEFVINTKKRAKGLDVGSNSNFGGKEAEVILPRGAQFTVTAAKRRLNKLTVYVDYGA